jgi:hypothetical protein
MILRNLFCAVIPSAAQELLPCGAGALARDPHRLLLLAISEQRDFSPGLNGLGL